MRGPAAAMNRPVPTPAETFVAVDGGRLFVRVWGDPCARAPFVLFHDSLGSVALWRDFPENLAAATGRAVIAYDRLGFARSDPREDRLARDFVHAEGRAVVPALRAALGFETMVLLGHSVGGGMAIATAAAFPETTRGLVTVAAQAFVEDRTLAGIRVAKAAFAEPGGLERLARHHGPQARWVLDAWIETWLAPDFADWTLDAALAALRCPVLAVHGADDEYGSVAHPERIAARAGGPATTLVLPACGHMPHREKPEEVLAAIAAFSADLDG